MRSLAMALTLLSFTAAAQEQKMAEAMFCDTPAQVKEVLTAEDPDAQIEAVNQRDGDGSCTSMRVVYDAREDIETFSGPKGMWTIMKVHVTGMMPLPGMMMPMDGDQYAARKVPGQGT